jgi:hypothetical protein
MDKLQVEKLLKASGFSRGEKHYSGFNVRDYPTTLEISYYHYRTAKTHAYLSEISKTLKASGIKAKVTGGLVVIAK